MLLESPCFLLTYHQEQIKGKRKWTWVREIFKKRIEQEVYHNLLQEMRVNDKECSFKVICIINFLEKVIKKNVWPFKVWLGPLLFIKILLKTAQVLSKHFPSDLSLCIFYFLFHKGKDTSAIPHPSVQHLVYAFPIFFRFHKWFNNFHLSKNILINKFIH